jgi:glyoxylase-like metal-dependent hydrolase (beta-lactamase superfamily II)/rhodanese-related sulfurtransferase
MNLSVRDLRARLMSGDDTFLLDVRPSKEFAAWRIEGKRPIDTLNVPYTRMLADAEDDIAAAAAVYLKTNFGDRIPRSSLVVTVCAKGGTSAFVAAGLRALGYDAINLDGGMLAWGNHYESLVVVEEIGFVVIQVARPARGCLSWIVVSGEEAVVVDPLRSVTPYLEILAARRARVSAVIDTHAHADHISGGRALASASGAPYYLHPYDAIHPMDLLPAKLDFKFLQEGSTVAFGRSHLEVLHVPGHTLGSVALLVDRRYLFAGDTLFVESVSRPDLGGQAQAWTPMHHASLRRLLEIGGEVLLLPGHFSSAGESDPRGAYVVPLAALAARNEGARMALGDLASFASYIQSSLPVFPPQYVDIKRVNAGLLEVDEDRARELELGKNVCALAGARSAP